MSLVPFVLAATLVAGGVLVPLAATHDVPAAATPVPAAQGAAIAADGLVLPVLPGVVVARFSAPASRWSAGHRGLDLLASAGTEVRSPADGVVVFAGVVVDRAVLTVDHGDGVRSSLEPVTGLVAVGTTVAAGQPIGTVQDARSHCAPRLCLHWGVRSGDVYVDPLGRLAGAGPVVLLPVP
jgi:murein DD-endopeptidase MepM/ murein hydrolase activator NlpD